MDIEPEMKEHRAKKFLEGLTETAVYLYRGPFWNVNHDDDYKKNQKFEWKQLERFAKIFRESLYLHFTFLEKFWAEELVSENNSTFSKESDFEQKNV